MTDNFLENLQAGRSVAVFLENFDKTPVIEKVMSVGDHEFQVHVHYLKGSFGGKRSPQHLPRRRAEPWLALISLAYCQNHVLFAVLLTSLKMAS